MTRTSVLLLLTFLNGTAYGAARRPHILYFIADDLGWNDVGFHGASDLKTPNLDGFASNGTILSNYYVCPVCSPSRGSLLTGQHPIHTGLQHDVILAGAPYGLPLKFTTFPQHLKKLGYSTHAVGKWHLGYFRKEYTPTYRGFDTFYGFYNGKSGYFDHTNLQQDFWGIDFWDNQNQTLSPVYDELGSYSTNLYADRAASIIERHNPDIPLFLYVANQAVHSGNIYASLEAPDEYINRFNYIKDINRRTFGGMVSAMDDSFGKITSKLAARGMLEDTIIVFTTDNGGPPAGFNSNAASNWPLRGTKASLWEGGVKGAGFLWTHGGAQRIYPGLVHITDWMPTIYSAAGGDPRKLGPMYGTNLWRNIHFGLPSSRSSILHNIDPYDNYASLRMDNYKLIYGRSDPFSNWDQWYSRPQNGTQLKGIIVCKDPPPGAAKCNTPTSVCLFNIDKDPCEYKNIASQEPLIANFLLEELHRWNRTAVPPLNMPTDPKSNPNLHDDLWTNWVDFPVGVSTACANCV